MSLCMKPVLSTNEARKMEQACWKLFNRGYPFHVPVSLHLGTAESTFLVAQVPLTRYFQSEFLSELKKSLSSDMSEPPCWRVDWVYHIHNYDINIFLVEQTSQKVNKMLCIRSSTETKKKNKRQIGVTKAGNCDRNY